MGYTVSNIGFETMKEQILQYEYALLYMISEIHLCKTEELKDIDWEQCQEARFFSENKEMHCFIDEEGKFKAVSVIDTNKDDIYVKSYRLAKSFQKYGKILQIKEHLAYDEDGQMYVALTCLKGIV